MKGTREAAGGFLRILRTLRLLHTYQLVERMRKDSPFFKRNEEVIFASVSGPAANMRVGICGGIPRSLGMAKGGESG